MPKDATLKNMKQRMYDEELLSERQLYEYAVEHQKDDWLDALTGSRIDRISQLLRELREEEFVTFDEFQEFFLY